MANRIPQSDGDFDSYINSTADYLAEGTPTNADRLEVSATQLTTWDTMRSDWNKVYAKYVDESKRTKAITADKNAQKKTFTTFANPILTSISVKEALTNNDRSVFKLPERDEPTHRVKINESPIGRLMPQEGGDLKMKVQMTADATRASRHPDADHVEMRYALLSAVPTEPQSPDPNLPSGPKETIPATADQCPFSTISTKANFTVSLGQAASGKRIYAFFRWVNASNLALSGPWSTVQQSVVV
jgi:hypothetical protein